VLNAQFLHVGVLRGRYPVHKRPAERRPEAAKLVYLRPHVHLLGFTQMVKLSPPEVYKGETQNATCNPLSSNDLRLDNFRLPLVYFRRENTKC